MLRKKGIVRKTFLFSALLIVLVTLVSFAILYFAMPSYYLYKKEQTLKDGLVKLEQELKGCSDKNSGGAFIAGFAEQYNVSVTTLDPDGRLIYELSSPFVSMSPQDEGAGQFIVNGESVQPGLEEELMSLIMQHLYQSESADSNPDTDGLTVDEKTEAYLLYETGNIMFLDTEIDSDIIGKLQIQGTLQPIEEARGVILSLIPYVLAAGCTIGLCLAWLYARRITKPILQLSKTAVRMKEREPGVASDIKTGDELGLLSENLDALYQSLNTTIEDLKAEMTKVNRLERSKTEMMQSASHELKTPIAALAGMLDGMIDQVGVYKDKDTYLLKCREQVEKLSFLVREILDASKADRQRPADKQAQIELDEMIRQLLQEYETAIRERGITVDTTLSPVLIETDPAVLYRTLANLLGNAVRYTTAGGQIRIILNQEQLVIVNQCDDIPQAEMAKLFEPFYTRSSSRDKLVSGTGLGLYIVKRNLERLSIRYHAECENQEFKFTLILK